jgi:PAS domain S-box-containing protein
MTSTASSDPLVRGVDDVLITAELASRPSRSPDYETESRALGLLAKEMATNPRGMLQKCAELVRELCCADSAGISILEPGGTSGMLRWHAAAGRFAPNLQGTMPREASPCGTVMERNCILLFHEAERFFPALRGFEPRIYENLLAPWHVKGKAVGTLWAISHTPGGRFDEEDARVLQSLACFASAAFQMTLALDEAAAERSEARASEERQAFLLKFSDALRAQPSADAVAYCAITMLSEHLRLDRCYITYYRPDDDEADFSYQVGNETVPPLPAKVRLSDFPDAYEQVLDKTFVIEDDFERRGLSEAERSNSKALGMRAMVASTVRRGERNPLCSMAAVSSRPRRWTHTEIALVEEAAERTWGALERARAEAALRESEQALATDLANAERLRRLSERLVPEENFQTIYDEILSATVAIMRADAGTIQIYDPAMKALELIASLNFSRSITDYFHRVDAGSRTACGIALKTGECAFVDFPDEVADLGCQLLTDEGIQSAVAYPLVSRLGTPLGMLNAHWRQLGRRPNDSELRFLDLLARQAADLIDRRQGERTLRESEERLRGFGEASQDVLWIRDAETLQWIYLTPAFEEAYGLDREAALAGDNMTDWLELIMPEDRQVVLDSLQQVCAGERVSFEYRIRRPGDDELRWLRDTDFPMRDGTGRVRWIGGVGRDITEEKTAVRRQEVLVNELQHRARNLLGVVTAVADRTIKQGGSVQGFEERLQALSRAQGLLSKGGSDTVEVGELVRAELAAYANGASDRVMISGPKVLLNARQVQNFALAVHELTTNAVKHGALKGEAGRLAATWEILVDTRERRRLALSWIESGIAIEPEKVTRRGYGTELIQEALAYALEAEVDYVLGKDGVCCRIEMPIT